jgi:predicted DNA-binding protein
MPVGYLCGTLHCVEYDEEGNVESQITIRLPEALHQRLERAAKSLGRRRSELARLAVQRYLDEIEGEPAPRPYERVRDLLGSLDSGVPDLGSRHREHLLAYFRLHGRPSFQIVP